MRDGRCTLLVFINLPHLYKFRVIIRDSEKVFAEGCRRYGIRGSTARGTWSDEQLFDDGAGSRIKYEDRDVTCCRSRARACASNEIFRGSRANIG